MKLVTVNHRHHGYRTWKFFLQFGPRGYLKTEQVKYNRAFTQLYGADRKLKPHDPNVIVWNNWEYNQNWRNDGKRFRIYYNNESDLSAVTLLI